MSSSQLTPQTLAHELNSLLDGALRWLSLAEQSTSELPDTVADEQHVIAERHGAARQALQQMAELIARAQGVGQLNVDALQSPRSIEDELTHVLSLLTPQCEQHGVELLHDLDPRAGSLPAGVLGPIMVNGLRNAIESCSHAGLSTRRVAISIVLRSPRALQLLIEDTGAGLPQPFAIGTGTTARSDGHGIGLPLCRSLVEQLGGVMELANVPYGGGAVLSVTVDPLRLEQRGADAA